MSKKIHLICNAHIDPVWQWEWEEGAAEARSTFSIAAAFCEEYDGFVFCHNEALLYQWIEEYDPALFERIRGLVKAGKWHIMGGWFLQPDCNMPSGEFMVRQIEAGRRYFWEKFGVRPEVAVNVDPFGHDRGLVQIMVKCGYKGYMFMRPDDGFLELPDNTFVWKGYDGSSLVGMRLGGAYNSQKGQAAKKVLESIAKCPEDDIGLCLWGIGNHGGGPSKKDLDDIFALTKQMEKDGTQLIQSTPDEYLAAVNERGGLEEFSGALRPWGIGCYTSQVRIKQKYRAAENAYFVTESMASHAAACALCEYPEKELCEALYDIIFVQFHDMLPGSSIQPAEEMGLRMLDHALEILSRVKARLFFALARGQKKAQEDKIPIFVYNPYPYELKSDCAAEFMLWDQDWEHGFMKPHVFDENSNEIPAQCEKEHSNLPIEWRKRVLFNATLAPMSINRFDCAFEALEKRPEYTVESTDDYYALERGGTKMLINRKTGLIDSVKRGGIEYLKSGAMALTVYKDNYDPWFMSGKDIKEYAGEFSLLTREQAARLCCLDAPIDAVRIIEDGAVRTVAEAVFGYNSSRAVVKYTLASDGSVRLDIRVIWDEKQTMVRLRVPAAFKNCLSYGEQMFGMERQKGNGEENVSQRFIALSNGENAILCANNGVYGSMYDEENGVLSVTLMRSAAYCAHPLPERITMPNDRYMPYMEQGERDFGFMFTFSDSEDIMSHAARKAQEFNAPPTALSFYPAAAGERCDSPLGLDSDSVCITAFKRAQDKNGYIVRLFNPIQSEATAVLRFKSVYADIRFGGFEVKTMRCTESAIGETDMLEEN